MKKKSRFEKNLPLRSFSNLLIEERSLVIVLCSVFFFRLPFLFEPLRNGPEAYWFALARNLLPGHISLSLFEEIPVSFVALSFRLFGPSVWSIHFLFTLWVVLGLFFLWFSSKRLLVGKSRNIFFLVLSFFLIVPWPASSLNIYTFLFLPCLIVLTLAFRLLSDSRKKVYPKFLFLLAGIFLLVFLANGSLSLEPNYYFNLASYLVSKSSDNNAEQSYLKSFGSDVALSYNLASYLKAKSKTDQTIYLLGDLISIYPLSDRRAATNHITYLDASNHPDETYSALLKNQPVYLLVVTDKKVFSPLDRLIQTDYNLIAQTDNVKLYKNNAD